MPIDRTFGSTGTIWTSVPEDVTPETRFDAANTRYLGGTAVGLEIGESGPGLVVSGWNADFVAFTRVLLAHFPSGGRPEEQHRNDGTSFRPLADPDTSATPLATCDGPGGAIAVLMRVVPPRDSPKFVLRTQYTSSIPSEWLFDPIENPNRGNVRMVCAGSTLAIVSSATNSVLIALLAPGAPSVVLPAINVAAGGALPGLTRLDIASVRFDGTRFSIALTAFLNHPAAGPVSQGAILRVLATGVRDASFGEDGLWVSPLTNQIRQFVTACEFDGGLAGVQNSGLGGVQNGEVVAFGVLPDGSGLYDLFGVDGVFRQSLGGSGLLNAVGATDGQSAFVFAQRHSDLLTVGCRFDTAGALVPQFGTGGIVTVPSDGAPLSPVEVKVSDGRLMIAATRQVTGIDCDRIPAVTVLGIDNGLPVEDFGAGGFALHSAIGGPAAIRPDGSCYYAERRSGEAPTALRRTTTTGAFESVISLSLPTDLKPTISSLFALDDGSLLIGGSGWIAKLSSDGSLDRGFGVNGFATPRPGSSDNVQIIGVRQDGRIAVYLLEAPRPRIGLLNSDGSTDPGYAVADGGFIEAFGFTHPGPAHSSFKPFLDEDGSIICVVSSSQDFAGGPNVDFALRRITDAGIYDSSFGLGSPDIKPPDSANFIKFFAPEGSNGSPEYSSVNAKGMAWMGSKLYIAATGVAGGQVPPFGPPLPGHDVLVVTRWNDDGTKDLTFEGTAIQEAGFTPDTIDLSASGVLPISPTQLIVFGRAGRAERVTITAGNLTYTNVIIRTPQPAIFSVSHPTGIHRTFGSDGGPAEVMPMQEFEAYVLAGRILPGPRRTQTLLIRLICADYRYQPTAQAVPRLKTNFGGIAQFVLNMRRLPR